MKNCYKLIIKAFLITLLLNSDKILHLINNSSLDFTSFSDVDEPYYLQDSIFSGQNLPSSAIYHEHSKNQISLKEQSRSRPNFLLSFILGKIINYFNLSPYTAGFLLDLIFPFISFLILVRLFGLISPLSAEIGALSVVMCPYLFAIDTYFVSNVQLFRNFHSAKIDPMTCLPVMRSIATQVSYPFFFLSIYFNLKFCLGKNNPKLYLLRASAVLNGICWYLYFFAWGSALGINLLFLLIWQISQKNEIPFLKRAKSSLPLITIYSIITMIVSAFGVYALFLSNFSEHLKIQNYPNIIYFNIELFLLAILLLLNFRKNTSNNYKIAFLLASCALLAELVLMNIGTIQKTTLAEYHFPQLFLQPIFTGVCCTVLLDLLRKVLKSKIIYRTFLSLCIISVCSAEYLRFYLVQEQAKNGIPYINLFDYVNKSISKNKVFVIPSRLENHDSILDISFVPQYFSAITNQKLLSQFWAPNITSLEESTERELLLGFLYSGQVNFIWQCPVKKSIHASDYLANTAPLYMNIFNNLCKEKELYDAKHNNKTLECLLLNKYKVDYVIMYNNYKLTDKNSALNQFLELEWDSGDGMKLYKFNQAGAILRYCNTIS